MVCTTARVAFMLWLMLLAALKTSAMVLNAEDIMIATVVDLSSPTIIRDAISLLRSMRLYGGSINSATFVVCITLKPGYQEVDPNIVASFVNLGAQVAYVHEVPAPKAKTLNKFKAFEQFDYLQYNHFLWLDADIIVFEDPMPYLMRHMHPGKIDCVPDFYSYMRRYPGLNETELMWNGTVLPDAIMIGDQQVVSHGHCNTGVLFFDLLSLQTFMRGLDELSHPDSELFEINNRSNQRGFNPILRRRNLLADRFVDSLLFVAIVNKYGIEVDFLPHSMNYMLYFEGEISQDTTTNNVVLAHLLSSSEVSCEEVNTGQFLGTEKTLKHALIDRSVQALVAAAGSGLFDCHCKYVNEHHNAELLGFQYISRLTREDDCMAMAGYRDYFLQTAHGVVAAAASVPVVGGGHSTTPGAACKLLSPVVGGDDQDASLIMHVDGLDYLAFWSEGGNAVDDSSGAFSNHVDTLSVHLSCLTDRLTGWSAGGQWDIEGVFSVSDSNPDAGNWSSLSSQSNAVRVHQLHHIVSGDGSEVVLQCDLVLSGLLDRLLELGHGSVPAASFIRVEGLVVSPPSKESGAVRVEVPEDIVSKLINTNKTPRGMITYENNLLLGSQLETGVPSAQRLHKYLNKFMFTATPGVVVCCDHLSTVATINSLVRHWQGSKLIVYVSSVPAEFSVNPSRYWPTAPVSEGEGGTGTKVETLWLRYLRDQVERADAVRRRIVMAQMMGGHSVSPESASPEEVERYVGAHSMSIAVVPTGIVRLGVDSVVQTVGTAFKSYRSDNSSLLHMLVQQPEPHFHLAPTKANSLSFVLLDSFHSTPLYSDSLRYWFGKLARYGLLLGPSDSVLEMHRDANLRCAFDSRESTEVRAAHLKDIVDLTNARHMVNKFLLEKKHVLMHTYASAWVDATRDAATSSQGCELLRAYAAEHMQLWYILKHK